MWIIFTVFFMLFLLSNEEKQRSENNSATNQEQKCYKKEKAMAAGKQNIGQYGESPHPDLQERLVNILEHMNNFKTFMDNSEIVGEEWRKTGGTQRASVMKYHYKPPHHYKQ